MVAERDERREAMAALLALERAQTDAHLVGERDRADAAIASRHEFLAVVSHDVRNMLGGIALSVASLKNNLPDEDGQSAIARDAQRSSASQRACPGPSAI